MSPATQSPPLLVMNSLNNTCEALKALPKKTLNKIPSSRVLVNSKNSVFNDSESDNL